MYLRKVSLYTRYCFSLPSSISASTPPRPHWGRPHISLHTHFTITMKLRPCTTTVKLQAWWIVPSSQCKNASHVWMCGINSAQSTWWRGASARQWPTCGGWLESAYKTHPPAQGLQNIFKLRLLTQTLILHLQNIFKHTHHQKT